MRSPRIIWISAADPPEAFPDVETACDLPGGLLAAGGNLSEERLVYAYRHGIFPWFNEGQPILWWSPDPRCVLRPDRLHISRRLLRALRHSEFEVSFNRAFDDVIEACEKDRHGQDGTWITPEMLIAYRNLHARGWAHSIEIWSGDTLAGGLYGLAIGTTFFGESTFSGKTNASKAAMIALCAVLGDNAFALLDCQVESPHLMSLGAELMPRRQFVRILRGTSEKQQQFDRWPGERLKIQDFRRPS